MEQKGEKREQDAEKYQSRSVYVCESRCEAPWKPGQGSRYDVYQTVAIMVFQKDRRIILQAMSIDSKNPVLSSEMYA